MRSRPMYSVVTAVVTILALIGMARMALRPMLPSPRIPFNYEKRGDYLQQGQAQQIGWLPIEDSDFVQAQHEHKPVLLVVGAAWSREARIADHYPFLDPDVQVLIPDSFVPVRVDVDENPELLNAFFPLSGSSRDLPLGFQVYFLTPNGRIYAYAPSSAFNENQDDLAATRQLVQGRNELSSAQGGSAAAIQSGLEVGALLNPGPGSKPDIEAAEKSVEAAGDSRNGGFPNGGAQNLKPEAFKFLLLDGKGEAVRSVLDPLLSSPIVDWLDGGFFRTGSQAWQDIQFDEIAVTNADMMEVVALYAQLEHSGFAKEIAEATFDALALNFRVDSGHLSSCRIGDEDMLGRSQRSSFSSKDVRPFWNSNILSSDDRKWARKYLNLDPNRNAQLTVYVSDESVLFAQNAQFKKVLRELRASKSRVAARYGTVAYADVNGYVAARLLECARLWGDGVRLTHALRIAASLGGFWSDGELHHRLRPPYGGPDLTDYLGYSDACLQSFLATGSAGDFSRGLESLMEAKRDFERKPGIWISAMGSREGLPKSYLAPGLADNLYESPIAWVIRLETRYGELSRGANGSARAALLTQDARKCVELFAKAANTLGIEASGYFGAAAEQLGFPYAVTVGPHALSLANRLYQVVPTRLVAPAGGPVRPDLAHGQAGIYVVHGSSVAGPLSLLQAARDLRTAAQ